MNMKKGIMLFFFMGIIVLGSHASGNVYAFSVDEIINKANLVAYYAGYDGRSRVDFHITDAQGRTRKREFIIARKDVKDGGEQKYYVYFKKPSDVRKMVFMVHKYIEKDDDRWLYLPAMDLVKRIAASDKRTSFVGSHFFYEDVSGRSLTEDLHDLLEETETHYVIKNTPREPDSVEFADYTVWIDKKSFLPVKAQYRNAQGEIYRQVEALKIKDIQGYPTVVKSRVKNLLTGGETVSTFKDIQYDTGIDDKIFTERYLRKPPRELRK